ncbi:MAG: zinc-ribbon domain containing protein [Euryarchaeota archaeon]|nr:zinc-ribbon domain containing protein [Euryarchaeota archaeon]
MKVPNHASPKSLKRREKHQNNTSTMRNDVLRVAADEFASKVRTLSSPLEVAIVGSVAGGAPHPNDLDLAIIISNTGEIATIAKYARQMSRHYHGWEVFLFDCDLSLIGTICHRRECPGRSVECYDPGCGELPHIRVNPEFEYDEKMFLTSPIDVLYTSFETSRLLVRKGELGIVESRSYPVMEDIRIGCIRCGETFVFTGAEQKWYRKRGLSQPKRCPDCIAREYEG